MTLAAPCKETPRGPSLSSMRQVVPSKRELERYLGAGMTQQQIAEDWSEKTNQSVSRSAIGMAIARYGLSSHKPRPRYEDLLPWKVKAEHRIHADARLLRLEGRRREGKPISAQDLTWLNNWLQELDDANAVIVYDPDTEQGFWWMERTAEDDDIIRRPKPNKGFRVPKKPSEQVGAERIAKVVKHCLPGSRVPPRDGLSRATIDRVKRGEKVSDTTLRALADMLGLPRDFLVQTGAGDREAIAASSADPDLVQWVLELFEELGGYGAKQRHG